jgi:aryl-alcohol dehydrogenase-like predicted oxidoreductase
MANTIVWRNESLSQCILGTVQLGLNYGIANTKGQPDSKKSSAIINTALDQGINCFDTAQAYGNSESIIGEVLSKHPNAKQVKIITKLNPKTSFTCKEDVFKSVEGSLSALKVEHVWAVFIHNEEALNNDIIVQALSELKEKGTIKYIGCSVYSVEKAKECCDRDDIDMIQIPMNMWDNRMESSGLIDLAKETDTCCFIRSCFLQGLLLMSPEQVKEKIPMAYEASLKWHELASALGKSPTELALKGLTRHNCPLVLGCDSAVQLNENMALLSKEDLSLEQIKRLILDMKTMTNEHILNPSLWEAKQ